MKKLLVFGFLAFVACKKDEPTVNRTDYNGKWYIREIARKQYTLDNGNSDTTYLRNEYSAYGDSSSYMNFNIDNRGFGSAAIYVQGYLVDSTSYEARSRFYFQLDSTVCEINTLNDSVFNFNTLIYDNATIPDKIVVTTDYFTMTR